MRAEAQGEEATHQSNLSHISEDEDRVEEEATMSIDSHHIAIASIAMEEEEDK